MTTLTEKELLRAKLIARRANVSTSCALLKSQRICKQLQHTLDQHIHSLKLPENDCANYRVGMSPYTNNIKCGAYTIGVYAPLLSEVDISLFTEYAYRAHCAVAFPCLTHSDALPQTLHPTCTNTNKFTYTATCEPTPCSAMSYGDSSDNAIASVPPRTNNTMRSMCMRAVSYEAYKARKVPFITHPVKVFDDDTCKPLYRLVEPHELDMLIVPLVGFNHQGQRLGYGGGFYDRYLPLLADRCVVIGVGFTEQYSAYIPTEPYDITLPTIISA